MTVTDAPIGRLEALDAKIDRLTEQMAVLTAEADQRRRQRESLADLTEDLSRVSEGAVTMATRELESLSQTVDLAETVRLLRRLLEVAPTLERVLVGLNTAVELVDDAAPLGTDMVALVTDRLATADERGYFRFASAAAGVADRVVTNFDEHDVELLGNNVVAMLEALREVTQPEMLAFLTRAVDAVQAEQLAVATEPAEPPSLWALARQMGDPDVRRGLSRALQTLRAVSVETGPNPAGVATAPRGARTPNRPTTPDRPRTSEQGDIK